MVGAVETGGDGVGGGGGEAVDRAWYAKHEGVLP